MNHRDDKQLETEIDRELKQLPEITAPGTLIGRVMRRIENPAFAPAPVSHGMRWRWTRRGALIASGASAALVLALALLLMAAEVGAIQAFAGRLQQSLSLFAVILNTAVVLTEAMIFAVKNLGVGVIAGGLMLLGVAYVTCIGAGMMMVRVAVVRR
ncbi:MAG TPA: hypothetical protein VK327_04735 [Candidatus Paceibacterota bacterium]|nr:hypothetical protein [Candidatus Paceibacterota bacterium]